MRRPLLALLALVLSLPLLPDAAHARSRATRTLSYDVVKGSLDVGRVKIRVSPPRGGKGLRRVRINADVDALGSKTLGMSIRSTSWLNRQWYPVKATWDWHFFGKKRRVRARFRKNSVDGKYEKDGKLALHMKQKRSSAIGDLVSFAVWVMNQKMTPGTTHRTTTYTGMKLYDVTMEVGQPETVETSAGAKEAYKVKVTAVRPGKTRHLTLWVDKKRGALLKLVLHADMLGDIAIVLRSIS